jgi:hypothetical protein
MKLLETYAKRLAVSDQVYAKEHDNGALTRHQKLTIARVLANESAFLNESIQSAATQKSDLTNYKKFCLDLTTVALPNLIANELVIVKPMTSMVGYVQYLQFVISTEKGGVPAGTLINDPFKLGVMTDERVNYTSNAVVDSATAGAKFTAVWTPIVPSVFENSGSMYSAKIITSDTVTATGVTTVTESFANFDENGELAATYFPAASEGHTVSYKVAYQYNNMIIPRKAMPTIKAQNAGITLEAKKRDIAIYYSQIAAFQAKTELGTDLGDVLATQACAELTYEIDNEVIALLYNTAFSNKDGDGNVEKVTFNKRERVGVSLADHFEGFAFTVEEGSRIIYDRTQKHAANYMVCASDVKPILSLMRGWKAANTGKINGPYFAGTLNGIKVFVSPKLPAGKFFLGFNGDDLATSAAIYAPYMAIVPTQLLGFADGGMSQGWSTLYDLKLLNACLLVAGEIVDEPRN